MIVDFEFFYWHGASQFVCSGLFVVCVVQKIFTNVNYDKKLTFYVPGCCFFGVDCGVIGGVWLKCFPFLIFALGVMDAYGTEDNYDAWCWGRCHQ